MQDDRAFEFNATWREFAPIAFTNLLLIIVTLGGYRFWAKTRERRFLWSRTRFIDERLEWTGTGFELMIGFALAFVLFILPTFLLSLAFQGAILRGHPGLVGLVMLFLYPWLYFLVGVARFRALRYRLSRTLWRGIRGGSDDNGVAYGLEYLWRSLVGILAIGFMVPWSMTTLWNKRWDAMSFGSESFGAHADWRPVIGRYLLFYAMPFILVILGFVIAIIGASTGAASGGSMGLSLPHMLIFALILLFYPVLGLIAAAFYAAYARETVGHTHWAGLDFAFDARTKDWIKFALGSFFLVLFTLGIGALFLGYRNWRFMTNHMQAHGEIDLDRLGQSTTRAPRQGEGLLDAFDVGAF
ncbi:Thymidylate kinase [Sphingomonas antarctica]